MTRRNIIRFIISFIFGVLVFWKIGGEAYADNETHTCSFVSDAEVLKADTAFTGEVRNIYYLQEDVKFTQTKIIDRSTTICLNGHVLKGDGTKAIFQIEGGVLTICDCQHDNEDYTYKFTVNSEKTWVLAEPDEEPSEELSVTGGVITNGGGTDGAIYIPNGGRLNLYNVNIVGNKALEGAIYQQQGNQGTVNINGSRIMGNGYYKDKDNISKVGGIQVINASNESTITNTLISNNVASNGGGIRSGGKLSLTNVKILNNQAIQSTDGGGGIHVNAGTLKLTDCTIQENTVDPYNNNDSNGYGAGIYCSPSSLTLNGTIKVSGNTRISKPNNVYLSYNKKIKLGSSINVEDSSIGISANSYYFDDDPLYVTDTVTTDYSSIFFNDDNDFDIVYDNDYIMCIKPYMIRLKNDSPVGCSFGVEGGNSRNWDPVVGVSPNTKITVNVSTSATYTLDSLVYFDGENETPISYNNSARAYTFLMPDKNIVIMPKFSKANVITFHPNGGRGSTYNVQTTDSTYSLPKCEFLPKGNKEFVGWSRSANGTIITEDHIDLSGDVTLYAIWKTHTHKPVTVNISDHITKTSCKCGFFIIRYN